MSVRNAGTAGPPTSTRISTVMGVPGPAGPPGSAGAAGAAGTNGNPGVNAFTRTSASFTMPAPGASVVASIANPITWIGVNQRLAIENAGVLIATAIGGTTVTLLNPNPAPAGNASTGTTIPSNSLVSPGGIGAAGPAGPAPPGIGPLVNQTSGVPLALSANEGQGAVVVGGIPQAVGLRRVFNVLSYGAVGDGAHDDGSAIQAAEHARANFNAQADNIAGGVLYFPTGTYLVNQELLIEAAGAVWEGDGAQGQSTIKAGSAIRSVLAVGFSKCSFESFRVDANRQADYGILRAGDAVSVYKHVTAINAKLDGFSSIAWQLAGRVVSGIVQTGGGPAITAAASNVVYGIDASTYYVEVSTAGNNDGSAQIRISRDGTTYGAAQPLFAQTEIAAPNTPTNAGVDLGVRLTAPSGSYMLGTVYQINLTYSGANAVNDTCSFINCRSDSHGALYATAGAYQFGGAALAAAGTVTTNNTTNVILGVGTSFLSLRARTGDFIYVTALSAWFQILCVLDDTHIAVGFSAIGTMGTHVGSDYIVAVGAAFYDAVQGDANVQSFMNCSFGTGCPQGMVLGGVIGNSGYNTEIDGINAVALSIGTDNFGEVLNTVFIRPYFEPLNNVVARGVFNTATTGVTILEPTNFDRFGPGNEIVTESGAIYGNARLIEQASALDSHTVTITAPNQVIPTPSMGVSGSGHSLIHLTAAQDFPVTIAAPVQEGMRIRLLNISSFYNFIMTSAPLGPAWTLEAPVITLGPNAYVDFVSFAGTWYQTCSVTRCWAPSTLPNAPGEGENVITTTDATLTEIYPVFALSGDSAIMGFEATITGSTSGGTVGAVYQGIFASFAKNVLLGTMTVDHATGTDAGNVPPAAWGGISLQSPGSLTSRWSLAVTGAAATTITWRCRIRFF